MNKTLVFRPKKNGPAVIVKRSEAITEIHGAGNTLIQSLDFIVCLNGNNLLYGAKLCSSPSYSTDVLKTQSGDSYTNVYFEKLNGIDLGKKPNAAIDYDELISKEKTNFLISQDPPNSQYSSISNHLVEAIGQKDLSIAFTSIALAHNLMLHHEIGNQKPPIPKEEKEAILAEAEKNKASFLKIAKLIRGSKSSTNRAPHLRKHN